MINKIVNISKTSWLETYIIDKSKYIQNGDSNTWQPEQRPAIIVIPGGGYKYIADSENEPIVFNYLKNGYSCFTLHYSIGDYSVYPTPLVELFKAIKYIRDHSEEYFIDSNAIIVCGFSAGAHLAALSAVKWNSNEFSYLCTNSNEELKPNGAILSYPIINNDKLIDMQWKHQKNWGKILEKKDERINILNYVNSSMSPCFIWHTRTDGIVPVKQSLDLVNIMIEKGVPVEYHMFYEGYHGLSTNDVLSNYKGALQNGIIPFNVSKWMEMSVEWINNLCKFNI